MNISQYYKSKAMKPLTLNYFSILLLSLIIITPMTYAKAKDPGQTIKVSLQKRIPSDLDEDAFMMVNEIQDWNGNETAVIICDMWDEHWCKGATSRVAEMAPLMNNVSRMARDK